MTTAIPAIVRKRARDAGGLGNAALEAAGTPEQKAKWGKLTLSMAITEPGTGSDSANISTTAVLDGDEWVLNGEKIFVTDGERCDVVVWVRMDHYEHTDKEHVCKSANYWKSLSEHPETPTYTLHMCYLMLLEPLAAVIDQPR